MISNEEKYKLHMEELQLAIEPKTANLSEENLFWLLEYSMFSGRKSDFRMLLDLKPNLQSTKGGDLLWAAIYSWNTKSAVMLIEAGVDLDYKRPQDLSSYFHFLLTPARETQHGLALLMIQKNADIHCKDANGNTVFHSAVKNGLYNIVETLLRKGLAINDFMNSDEQYPLHVACEYNRIEIIRLLLHLGADVNVTDKLGSTPFSMIELKPRLTNTTKFIIQYFARAVENGTRINERDLNEVQCIFETQKFFKSCIEELKKMRKQEIIDGLTYYCFLNKSIRELGKFKRNTDVIEQLSKKIIKVDWSDFPIFQSDIRKIFGLLRKFKRMLVYKEQELKEIFANALPKEIIQMIAEYTCLVELIH